MIFSVIAPLSSMAVRLSPSFLFLRLVVGAMMYFLMSWLFPFAADIISSSFQTLMGFFLETFCNALVGIVQIFPSTAIYNELLIFGCSLEGIPFYPQGQLHRKNLSFGSWNRRKISAVLLSLLSPYKLWDRTHRIDSGTFLIFAFKSNYFEIIKSVHISISIYS